MPMTITATEPRTDPDVSALMNRLRPPPLPAQTTWRSIRRQAGVSIKDVAEQLGVDQMTVSRWERGVSYPQIRLRRSYRLLLIALHELAAERATSQTQK